MKKTLTHLTFPIAAGDNIPGHQPNNPCALKGRWRKPILFADSPALMGMSSKICATRHGAFGIRVKSRIRLCASAPLREKSVSIRLPRRSVAKRVANPQNYETNPIFNASIYQSKRYARQESPHQGYSNLFKAVQPPTHGSQPHYRLGQPKSG
jgi:hypothetical protein